MFTGIVTAAGRLAAAQPLPAGRRMRVELPGAWDDLVEGESVAVDGCCLTVEAHGGDGSGRWMTCAAGHQTLKRTTLGARSVGDTVHLERALRLSDRLGGHLVTGHVDEIAEVVEHRPAGVAVDLRVRVSEEAATLLVPKGSVAIDGVSLTVADVTGCVFSVMIIPHTQAVTHLADLRPGARVNLETDLVGKYVARVLGKGPAGDPRGARLAGLLGDPAS